MKSAVWHQLYDTGVPISLDYPSHPMDYFLKKTAAKYPNKTALIFGGMIPLFGEQHSRMNYQTLDRLVDSFAAGMQKLGLQKGDRVILHLPNCPQYVIAYYGILRAGGIVVPSNPLYVAREIEHQIKDSGASYAVVLSMFYHKIIWHNTALKQVIVTNIKEYFPGLLKTLFTLTKERKNGHRVDISNDSDTSWFQDFLASASPTPQPVEIKMEDTAILMYTGGTTGIPKGAELTHKNITANVTQATNWLNRGDDEIILTVLPMTHSYSMTVCMNYSIVNGCTQVLIPNPRNFIHLLTAINTHNVTIMPGVPTLYSKINSHPDVISGKYSMKSIDICICGAAGLPAEVQQEFQQITGGRLVEGYGLSETSPITHVNPIINGGRIGAIGIPFPDTDAKIVDQKNEVQELGANEAGILCVSGPQVMKGYWGNSEETDNSLRVHADGKIWLHTGDIAEMSEDGYFHLIARKKYVILASGGFNVYPREIEERLYENHKVLEAVAIGVPVDSHNQRAKVFIVLREGQTATEQEMIKWCANGLAKYKTPKSVEFRTHLPKTAVGKILRRELMAEEKNKEVIQ